MKKKQSFPRAKLALLLLLIFGGGYLALNYLQSSRENPAQVLDYSNAVVQSSGSSRNASESKRLTDMLASGINTQRGVLQSVTLPGNTPQHYGLALNGEQLPLRAVSPLELVRAFVLDDKQVLLLGFDQGGNQCSRLYQLISIASESTTVSNPFGSCLPLSSIEESAGELILKMPQNNPYLGPDMLISYRYSDGVVSQLAKPGAKAIKQKFANLTPTAILQVASQDGCYVDGVLLDDNSCAGGRKYCVMFRQLSNPAKDQEDQDYQTLHSFCKQ